MTGNKKACLKNRSQKWYIKRKLQELDPEPSDKTKNKIEQHLGTYQKHIWFRVARYLTIIKLHAQSLLKSYYLKDINLIAN